MSRPAGSKNKANVKVEEPKVETAVVEKVIETPITSTMPIEQIKIVDNNLSAKVKDLESRIHEIECFRNPNAIEGRIRDMGQQIEEIKVQIDKINGLLKKAYAVEEQKVSANVLKHSLPGA